MTGVQEAHAPNMWRSSPMPGKFVLKKVKTGYHFVLKAGNGETIAQSEVSKSTASALNGIASVKKNASAPVSDETGE
jgi:uncharacterized protein